MLLGLPSGHTAQLLVLDKSRFCYDVTGLVEKGVDVEFLDGVSQDEAARLIASRVETSPNHTLYYHLPDSQLLKALGGLGVKTIPVIQNMQSAWRVSALELNQPHILFVACVSDAVARELRSFGCRKRIVPIRHEIDPLNREPTDKGQVSVRTKLGISEDTTVIAMVGQFKTQKCYPRAVKILSAVKQRIRVKLLIIGGWDRENQDSRSTYDDTLRSVEQLGLEEDILILGNISSVGEYLQATDVFLNTSVFEGLSVSMLEAQEHGCAIVATDVGGARETSYKRQIFLDPNSSTEEFVDAIIRAKDMPHGDKRGSEPRGMIPFLWLMLATYGWIPPLGETDEPVDMYLCSADSLSETKRVTLRYSNPQQIAVGVFGRPSFEVQEDLQSSGARVRRLSDRDVLLSSQDALRYIKEQRACTVYLVGVDIRVKLLLSKILSPRVALIDVQDYASLFSTLENNKEFQQRICSDASAYYSRLRSFPPFSNGVLMSVTYNEQ